MKKTLQVLIGASFFCCMLLAGSLVFAYTWTVQFPSDLDGSVTSCTVQMHDKTANIGTGTVTRGSSTNWSSTVVSGQPSPLFYVDGSCNYTIWGTTQKMFLKGRICDGTDFTNIIDPSKACSKDVSLKLCRKDGISGSYSNYYFGFCPN